MKRGMLIAVGMLSLTAFVFVSADFAKANSNSRILAMMGGGMMGGHGHSSQGSPMGGNHTDDHRYGHGDDDHYRQSSGHGGYGEHDYPYGGNQRWQNDHNNVMEAWRQKNRELSEMVRSGNTDPEVLERKKDEIRRLERRMGEMR